MNFNCGERILSLSADDTGCIYVGTASGAVKRFFFDSNGEAEEERSYRLELKCSGAQIDGVHPREQYIALQCAVNAADGLD